MRAQAVPLNAADVRSSDPTAEHVTARAKRQDTIMHANFSHLPHYAQLRRSLTQFGLQLDAPHLCETKHQNDVRCSNVSEREQIFAPPIPRHV